METNLLDKMLSTYRSRKTPVTIVLQNKARVTGRIDTFDSYVIIMGNNKQEIVYRHAISSILPVVAAVQAPQAERTTGQTRPAVKPAGAPRQQPKRERRPSRPAPKPAAAPVESGLNDGMKEGLLRWMQEQKSGK